MLKTFQHGSFHSNCVSQAWLATHAVLTKTGMYTNDLDLINVLLNLSKPILKITKLVAQELYGRNVLVDVIKLLDDNGWIHRRIADHDMFLL